MKLSKSKRKIYWYSNIRQTFFEQYKKFFLVFTKTYLNLHNFTNFAKLLEVSYFNKRFSSPENQHCSWELACLNFFYEIFSTKFKY